MLGVPVEWQLSIEYSGKVFVRGVLKTYTLRMRLLVTRIIC